MRARMFRTVRENVQRRRRAGLAYASRPEENSHDVGPESGDSPAMPVQDLPLAA
ncbi:MAG: hypothetical protein M3O22_05895 [Pseudomonadota bacterium]|nr:hypothetical protein [Pseudomonadota bacterium]